MTTVCLCFWLCVSFGNVSDDAKTQTTNTGLYQILKFVSDVYICLEYIGATTAVDVSKSCDGKLMAKPSFKPLGQYLDFTSNHAPHVLCSWPRAMVSNIPRLCLNTNPSDAVQTLLDRFEGCYSPSLFLNFMCSNPIQGAKIQVRPISDTCRLKIKFHPMIYHRLNNVLREFIEDLCFHFSSNAFPVALH